MTSLDNMVTSNPAFINMIITILGILYISIHYCLQTKFAKVMFSQVFVCPRGGGGCPGRSLSRRVSLQRGLWSLSRGISLSRGVSVQGCLCSEGCLSGGFLSRRGLCPVVSLSRGSLSRGVSVKGGFCPRGLCQGDPLQ